MLASMRDCWEEEMTTEAPNSRQASATQKPMPELPPMTRTREPASLLLYFLLSVMLGGFLGGVDDVL